MQSPVCPESSTGQALRRSLLKCLRCRCDKKKCEPFQRDWDQASEKCKRCYTNRYECGPRQTAALKVRQKKSNADLAARRALVDFVGRPSACTHNSEVEILDRPVPSALGSSKHERAAVSATTGCVQSMERSGIMQNDCQQALLACATWFTADLVPVFDVLATILASQQVILRCQSDVIYLEDKAGHQSVDIEHFFRNIFDQLRREFDQRTITVKSCIEKYGQAFREKGEMAMTLWLSKARLLRYQQLLLASHAQQPFTQDSSMIRPIYNPIFDQHEVMLCTANTLFDLRSSAGLLSAGKPRAPCQEGLRGYRMASKKLGRTFRNLSLFSPGAVTTVGRNTTTNRVSQMIDKLQNGIPACHIAYWNHDTDVSIKLWQDCRDYEEPRDFIQRTFMHILVEAGDIKALKDISRAAGHKPAFSTAGLDNRGMSLLAIAALQGRHDVFAYCFDMGAHKCTEVIKSGQSLLHFALVSGSKEIVEKLLKERMVQLLSSHIASAIERGHQDIATCLVGQLATKQELDINELLTLSGIARQKGMKLLENHINVFARENFQTQGSLRTFPLHLQWFYDISGSTNTYCSDDQHALSWTLNKNCDVPFHQEPLGYTTDMSQMCNFEYLIASEKYDDLEQLRSWNTGQYSSTPCGQY